MSMPFAYIYWALQRFFRLGWTDGLTEWKAGAVICVAQVMVLYDVIGLVLVRIERGAVPYWRPLVPAGAVVMSLVAVAVYVYFFRYRKILSKERVAEFEAYPSTTRMLGDILTALLFIAVFAFTMLFRGDINALQR